MIGFIRFADNLSAWFGKAFAWLIVLMAFGTGYEVVVRYVFNNPTAWSLDVSFIMYGTLFMMGGWKYAARSWSYAEVSVNSPAGIPIYQFKTVIVAAGILLFIQGIAQVCRCIHCMRTNEWLKADEDVFETEDLLMQKAAEAEKDAHP